VASEVYAAIRKKDPKLDYPGLHPNSVDGCIGIGKRNWPCRNEGWPSGFYISQIGLADLTSEEGEHPNACVWIKPPAALGLDLVQTTAKVKDEIPKVLPPELLTKWREGDDSWTCFWYPLPEPRRDLTEMFLKGQADEFIDRMISHFEVLMKFTPVVDEIFSQAKKVVLPKNQ
jgi:hypothetical protein